MSETTAGDVPVVTENTTQQVHVTEVPEAEAKITPQTIGVDQASFDKYYKPESGFDWASYGKEQEFKAAQRGQAPEPEAAEDKPEVPEGAAEAVEKAGLDWEALGTQVQTTGDISDEDYAALAAIGIPEQVVQDYISAVRNESQNIIDSVIDGFGGQEAFEEVFAALHNNSTLEQRNAIDVLLRDPNTRAAGIYQAYQVAGLQPQSEQPAAAQPAASRGTARATPGIQGFGDLTEQAAAQADPRYRTDPAYREQVMQRIAASNYTFNPRSHSGGL